MNPPSPRHVLKRADLMVDEIKRWIVAGDVRPGELLPNEAELRRLFSMSKGTVREALKSLEMQGLVSLKAGPKGGAMVTEVDFARTFQLLQNHFFFQPVDLGQIYAMRRLLEPELAAAATLALTEADLAVLEASLADCVHGDGSPDARLAQGSEDLAFHDLIARACPNVLLRFQCLALNEMLRRLVVLGRDLDGMDGLGQANQAAHHQIMAAFRARDPEASRQAMAEHIAEAEAHVTRLGATYRGRLLLDADFVTFVRLASVGLSPA